MNLKNVDYDWKWKKWPPSSPNVEKYVNLKIKMEICDWWCCEQVVLFFPFPFTHTNWKLSFSFLLNTLLKYSIFSSAVNWQNMKQKIIWISYRKIWTSGFFICYFLMFLFIFFHVIQVPVDIAPRFPIADKILGKNEWNSQILCRKYFICICIIFCLNQALLFEFEWLSSVGQTLCSSFGSMDFSNKIQPQSINFFFLDDNEFANISIYL